MMGYPKDLETLAKQIRGCATLAARTNPKLSAQFDEIASYIRFYNDKDVLNMMDYPRDLEALARLIEAYALFAERDRPVLARNFREVAERVRDFNAKYGAEG